MPAIANVSCNSQMDKGAIGKLGAWRGYVAVACCLLQVILPQSAACFTWFTDVYTV